MKCPAILLMVVCLGGCFSRTESQKTTAQSKREDQPPLQFILSAPEGVLHVGKKIEIPVKVKNIAGVQLTITKPYYGSEVWLVDTEESFFPVPARAEQMPNRDLKAGEEFSYNRCLYWTDSSQLFHPPTGERQESVPALRSPGTHTLKLRIPLRSVIRGVPGMVESNEIRIRLQ